MALHDVVMHDVVVDEVTEEILVIGALRVEIYMQTGLIRSLHNILDVIEDRVKAWKLRIDQRMRILIGFF